MAAGVIGGNIITNWTLNQVGRPGTALAGFSLPGIDTNLGRLAYSVGIPTLASIAVSRARFPWAEKAATGLLISGALTGIQYLIIQAQGFFDGGKLFDGKPPVAAAGAYLDAPPIPGVGALPAIRPGGAANTPGYDAIDAFGQGVYTTEGAFAGSAWD